MLYLWMIVQDFCGYFHFSINQRLSPLLLSSTSLLKYNLESNIKSLQSDGGGEFTCNAFKEFLQDK